MDGLCRNFMALTTDAERAKLAGMVKELPGSQVTEKTLYAFVKSCAENRLHTARAMFEILSAKECNRIFEHCILVKK